MWILCGILSFLGVHPPPLGGEQSYSLARSNSLGSTDTKNVPYTFLSRWNTRYGLPSSPRIYPQTKYPVHVPTLVRSLWPPWNQAAPDYGLQSPGKWPGWEVLLEHEGIPQSMLSIIIVETWTSLGHAWPQDHAKGWPRHTSRRIIVQVSSHSPLKIHELWPSVLATKLLHHIHICDNVVDL